MRKQPNMIDCLSNAMNRAATTIAGIGLSVLCASVVAGLVAPSAYAAQTRHDAPSTEQYRLPGDVALDMVRIPAGAFVMGSEQRSDESPPRRMRIDYDFYLGKYPITQEQWEAVMGENPASERGGLGAQRPAQGISWNSAQDFVAAINELGIGTFRLPSEAEWEYACRAGSDTNYFFGDDAATLQDYAWYNANSSGATQPVGQKLPNPFGLYDTHGNVWEWVQDALHLDYYGAPVDGSAWEDNDEGGIRILRGGAYLNSAIPCRSAYRNADMAGSGQYFFGLRLARDVDGTAPTPFRAEETAEEREARMAWWREARFGMFIHWGVYAVPAGVHQGEKIPGIGEWIMFHGEIPLADYRQYAAQFNPVKYDPDAWVQLAKQAGMKYMVITAKHHDGFALFETKASDWNVIQATPYGKDLLRPLVEACERHDMPLGFYYSEGNDWYHPGGIVRRKQYWDDEQAGDFDAYLDDVAAPQLRELLANYGDVAILWWDGPGYTMDAERAGRLMAPLALQPDIITNNRLGGGFQGDTDTPEQRIPATGIEGRDWETCMTMNDTWGYKSYDDNWKSVETLLHNLIDIVSKGGNFLLNVGPTAQGLIPEPSVERLLDIGAWMDVNSEAIHGATASRFPHLPWGRSTTRLREDGATLYLHVFDWPEDGQLRVPGLQNDVRSATLLDGGEELAATRQDQGWTLEVPTAAPHPIASVIAIEIAGAPTVKEL